MPPPEPDVKLTDTTSYDDAQRHFSSQGLWDLFDGDRAALNLAHECIDRHATDPSRVAVRVVRADGALGGYRFGVRRKRWLLARERRLAAAGVPTGAR